jgi:adenine-specific DNA-methyltransferase
MPNEFARQLRSNLTDAEQFAWKRLRRGQIGEHKFRRQHPLGPYVVDFVCLERKLVIELDGGQHAEQALEDARRTKWLAERGYRVIRFWNHEVLQDWETVEQEIWRQLHAGPEPTPHPNPPPQGGREQERKGEA